LEIVIKWFESDLQKRLNALFGMWHYAAETWTFSKVDRNGIEAFEVWIWRKVHVKDQLEDSNALAPETQTKK